MGITEYICIQLGEGDKLVAQNYSAYLDQIAPVLEPLNRYDLVKAYIKKSIN